MCFHFLSGRYQIYVSLKICIQPLSAANLVSEKKAIAFHCMKKNILLIIIILVAALLVGLVIWIYARRIESLENKMKISTGSNMNGTGIIDTSANHIRSKVRIYFLR